MSAAGGGRFKLLIVGIGGQGVITAARFVGEAAFLAGREVTLGQLHGMSQRGGSVRSTVILGPGSSSFIEAGSADAVLALEPLEALRARPSMSAATTVVLNRAGVAPPTLTHGLAEYPDVEQVVQEVRKVAARVVEVEGTELARRAGESRTLNIAMLGALVGLGVLPLDHEAIWRGIEARSPARFLEPNRRAFALGRETVRG